MTPEQIAKLKVLADKHDPNFDAGDYWDSGNFDDCFNLGAESGHNDIYWAIKNILENK